MIRTALFVCELLLACALIHLLCFASCGIKCRFCYGLDWLVTCCWREPFGSFLEIYHRSNGVKQITTIIWHSVSWIYNSSCVRKVNAWRLKMWLNNREKQFAYCFYGLWCRHDLQNEERWDMSGESRYEARSRISELRSEIASIKGQLSGVAVNVNPSGRSAVTAAVCGINRMVWRRKSKQGAITCENVVWGSRCT